LGLLSVWRAELSELLCDFAAWFSASLVSSSVVCRCSWLGVCSAAGVSSWNPANCGVAAASHGGFSLAVFPHVFRRGCGKCRSCLLLTYSL